MRETTQFNARLPLKTIDQIHDLAERLGSQADLPRPYSQAEVMVVAINRLADALLTTKKVPRSTGHKPRAGAVARK